MSGRASGEDKEKCIICADEGRARLGLLALDGGNNELAASIAIGPTIPRRRRAAFYLLQLLPSVAGMPLSSRYAEARAARGRDSNALD
jgi:hypothetical protein